MFDMLTPEIWHSALQHGVIALLIQLLLWPLFGIWSAGGIAVAIFLGREIAQHEYKGGGPKTVSWDYGLLHDWTLDSSLDVLLPVVFCLALAMLAWLWRRRKI